MRMAEHKLIAQAVADISDVELLLFTAYLCIEKHMKEDIAQFLADFRRDVCYQGCAKFIGFFYGGGTKAFVGLLAVPWALLAKFVEDVDKT